MASRNYPLGKRGQVIGHPYQGTHAVAFNKKGGSNNWESENAYDIAVPVGTPVYAVSSGRVGDQIGSQGAGGRFAGLRLHLSTQGNEFYYGHLSKIVVHAGEQVTAGALLGYSGEANGVAHLHFAAKSGDPAAWFGGQPKAGPSDPGVAPAVDPSVVAPAQPVAPVAPVAGRGVDMGVQPSALSTQPFEPPPGSGIASTNGYVADLWNRIASQPGVSPDTVALAQNAQLAGG